MKLSTMSYTMARGMGPEYFDIARMCKLTAELGIDAVDFCGLHGHEPQQVRAIMDDHGLKTCCYTFGADLNYEDPADRAPGLDTIRRGMEVAAILGTNLIMVPTPSRPDRTREQSRRNAMDGFLEIMDEANAAGVTITVEHRGDPRAPFILAEDCLEAVRGVPGLKICYDNGNIFTGGEDPAESFTRQAEHVVHAHFKDWYIVGEGEGFRGLSGQYYKGALIGEGAMDTPACVAAMRAAGYSGYINVEYEGNDYEPEAAMRKATAYLNGLLG